MFQWERLAASAMALPSFFPQEFSEETIDLALAHPEPKPMLAELLFAAKARYCHCRHRICCIPPPALAGDARVFAD